MASPLAVNNPHCRIGKVKLKQAEWVERILVTPTTSVPEAGRVLGIDGRNQAYQAAKRGEIKTLKFGRTLRVPTAWLRRQIQGQ